MGRVVQAPRAHVYRTWRRPERMARWWSAEHPGGAAIRCIDGAHRVGSIVIRVLEEVAPERLVFTWGDGDRATTRVTVTFHEVAEGTRLAIHQELPAPHDHVLLGSLDRLAILLRSGAV